jgi:hypothetical protein
VRIPSYKGRLQTSGYDSWQPSTVTERAVHCICPLRSRKRYRNLYVDFSRTGLRPQAYPLPFRKAVDDSLRGLPLQLRLSAGSKLDRATTPARSATPGRENRGANVARRAESPATPSARPPRRLPLGIPGGTPVASYPRPRTPAEESPAELKPTSRYKDF